MNEQTSVEDFLMPGHVWTHVAKGTEATVLFVTNNHLSEKLLESYPSHVVYLDAKGNLTSATVAQFTKTRGFSHVEPAVESAIESLVATINQDDNITLEAEDSDSAAYEFHHFFRRRSYGGAVGLPRVGNVYQRSYPRCDLRVSERCPHFVQFGPGGRSGRHAPLDVQAV